MSDALIVGTNKIIQIKKAVEAISNLKIANIQLETETKLLELKKETFNEVNLNDNNIKKAVVNNEILQRKIRIQFLNQRISELEQKEKEDKEAWFVNKIRELHKGPIETIFQQAGRIGRFGYSLLGKTVAPVAIAVGAIAFPVRLAISGIKALWDLGFAFIDKKMPQRKTRMAYSVTNIAAVGLIAGFMATPLGFAILSTITMFTGLVKESYTTNRARKAVTDARIALEKDRATLAHLKKEITPENQIRIEGLDKQIKCRQKTLTALREKRLDTQAKVGYYTVGLVGAGLIVAGLLFPPLAIAGAALLLANAICYTIDKRNKNPISGWFAKQWDKVRGIPVKTETVVEAKVKAKKPNLTKSHSAITFSTPKSLSSLSLERSNSVDLIDVPKHREQAIDVSSDSLLPAVSAVGMFKKLNQKSPQLTEHRGLARSQTI